MLSNLTTWRDRWRESTRFVSLDLPCFSKDARGSVMVYVGVVLPVLLGVSGLALDVGLWYMNKRITQAAADAAALDGALAIFRIGDNSTVVASATESATANGYDSSAGDVLTVNNPPTSGPSAGDANAVETIVQRPSQAFLARIIYDKPVTVTARAVAVAETSDDCIWVLNPSEDAALKIAGNNATVNINCGIFVNSDDPEAILQNSDGSCVNASQIKVVGGYSGPGTCITPPQSGAAPRSDPLAGFEGPNYGGCDHASPITVADGETLDLTPGVYCAKINVKKGGTLNLAEGTYVMDNAGLQIGGNVEGSGVSFYLTENTTNSGSISMNSGANVNLSAPTGGYMAGILFAQSPDSIAGIGHTFNGQADINLDGILHFPNGEVTINGGSVVDPTGMMIIADKVKFAGNTEIGAPSGSTAIKNPLLVSVTLAE